MAASSRNRALMVLGAVLIAALGLVAGLALAGDDDDTKVEADANTSSTDVSDDTTDTTDTTVAEGGATISPLPPVATDGLEGPALELATLTNQAALLTYHAVYEGEHLNEKGQTSEVKVEIWRQLPLARRDTTIAAPDGRLQTRELRLTDQLVGCVDTEAGEAEPEWMCVPSAGKGVDPAEPILGTAATGRRPGDRDGCCRRRRGGPLLHRGHPQRHGGGLLRRRRHPRVHRRGRRSARAHPGRSGGRSRHDRAPRRSDDALRRDRRLSPLFSRQSELRRKRVRLGALIAAFIIIGLVGATLAIPSDDTRNTTTETSEPADTSTTEPSTTTTVLDPSRLGPEGQEVYALVQAGRASDYYVRFDLSGANLPPSATSTSLEIWRSGPRLRQDTDLVDATGTTHGSNLGGPDGTITCRQQPGLELTCRQETTTPLPADADFLSSIMERLGGAEIVARDDTIVGVAVRCFVLDGDTEANRSEVCLSATGVPLLVEVPGLRARAEETRNDPVDPAVFVPPAPVSGESTTLSTTIDTIVTPSRTP